MTACDDYIRRLQNALPEMCNSKDLVKCGIFKTEASAYNARRKGTGPEFFKMPHGNIMYPKEGIIKYLQNSKHD